MEKLTITDDHLIYCFDVLINSLNKEKKPSFPDSIEDIKSSIFVTWKKGEDEDLRGCIGTFEA